MSSPLLEVDGLIAGYGGVIALRGVSLRVARGEAVVMIGVNGAGKSTLLKTIVGQIPALGGRVRLGGVDVTGIAPERALRLGVAQVPEGRQVFPDLTVRENLELGGYAIRRDRVRLHRRIEELEAVFPVLGMRHRQAAGTLSGGEQQMLAIARALMSEPQLLLLDEPSLGLAPKVCRELFDLLATLRSGGLTMLLVEQLAYLALGLADRGYLLENGEVVLEGTAEALRTDDRVREIYLGAKAG